MPTPDQRRHTRELYRVEVSLQSAHNFWAGFTENISEGGLFIATDAIPALGETVEIEFCPPGYDHALRVRGIVRWVRPTRLGATDAPAGFGIEFVELPPDVAAAINAFILSRTPVFYDDST